MKLSALPGRAAFGAKVTVRTEAGEPYQELYPVRGYQSCVEPVLHFGLGEAKEVQRVEIVWPDGRVHFLRDPVVPTVNSVLTVDDDGGDMITG